MPIKISTTLIIKFVSNKVIPNEEEPQLLVTIKQQSMIISILIRNFPINLLIKERYIRKQRKRKSKMQATYLCRSDSAQPLGWMLTDLIIKLNVTLLSETSLSDLLAHLGAELVDPKQRIRTQKVLGRIFGLSDPRTWVWEYAAILLLYRK